MLTIAFSFLVWLLTTAYAGLLYSIKWLRGINSLLEEYLRLRKNFNAIKGLKKKNRHDDGDSTQA